MESTCQPGRIQLSESCYQSLNEHCKWRYETLPRGGIFVKGKGDNVPTHWLIGPSGSSTLSPQRVPVTVLCPVWALLCGLTHDWWPGACTAVERGDDITVRGLSNVYAWWLF